MLADCLLGAIDVKGRDIYLATSYSSLLVERRLEGDESLWVDPGGGGPSAIDFLSPPPPPTTSYALPLAASPPLPCPVLLLLLLLQSVPMINAGGRWHQTGR